MTSTSKTLLVLGGTSDIGRATAQAFADQGWQIQLAGRDLAALRREADHLSTACDVEVTIHAFDVLDIESFSRFADGLPKLPDTVVCVVGLNGDQSRAETDLGHATAIMRSNYEGPSLILGIFVNRFLARSSGTIVGVSSVAGDRGRQSNYVYGSAKAGFTAFLSGLRNRTAKHGIHVVTVKPGYVRTKMTEGMRLPGALTASPSEVGYAIWQAVHRGVSVVYVRSIWRLIMAIIRAIPEPVFRKLRL